MISSRPGRVESGNVLWTNEGPMMNHDVATGPMRYWVPGFVDIHFHGAFGTDFMSASKEEMVALADRLATIGYEAFLPTTVTASLEAVKRALANMPHHPLIPGFHLEGPFISPEFAGVQPMSAIQNYASADKGWQEVLDDPRLRIVTLASEQPGGLELTKYLSEKGVIVSLGHTAATYDEVVEAIGQGAQHTTHTFNAMRALHHRDPGAIGAALERSELQNELIYDRKHVHKASASLLLKAKGVKNVIAVSDSTLASGLPVGQRVNMWGHECITGPGEVRLAQAETLAGSAVTMLEVFKNLWHDFSFSVAAEMCSWNPRRALGMGENPKAWLEFSEGGDLIECHWVGA